MCCCADEIEHSKRWNAKKTLVVPKVAHTWRTWVREHGRGSAFVTALVLMALFLLRTAAGSMLVIIPLFVGAPNERQTDIEMEARPINRLAFAGVRAGSSELQSDPRFLALNTQGYR
jgi:hypothetical protein